MLAAVRDQERGDSGVEIGRSGRVEDSDSKGVVAESERVRVRVREREGEETGRGKVLERTFFDGHVGNSRSVTT